MNDDSLEKYYSLFLYGKVSDIYLMEDRVLKEDCYTQNPILFQRNSFMELVESSAQIHFSTGGIDLVIPYQTYELCNIDYAVANDFSLDGFSYDAEAGRIIYGSTFVYVVLKDGIYREIITGKEIPDTAEHSIYEIRSVPGLQRMYQHLKLISEHKDIYVHTFLEIMEKLAIGHKNYLVAYQEYVERMQIFLKQQEELAKKERAIQEKRLLAESYGERQMELVKIQSILSNIQNYP